MRYTDGGNETGWDILFHTHIPSNSVSWQYRMKVGIPDNVDSPTFRNKVLDQLGAVENNLNTAGFNNSSPLTIIPIFFTYPNTQEGSDAALEMKLPDADGKLVYSNFTQRSYYHQDDKAIQFGAYSKEGWFDQNHTAILIHEFGHYLGNAFDLYQYDVLSSSSNPISGDTYESPPSVMNNSYATTAWDQHSINLINATNGFIPTSNESYKYFPKKIAVSITDVQGVPVEGTVKLYPVDSGDNSKVNPNPLVTTQTVNGQSVFASNPFLIKGPFGTSIIIYKNFLVEVVLANATKLYQWMPIHDVHNAFFYKSECRIYSIIRI
ncbi:hypothetical protein [Paenibacillus sp. L3-i20]|uniref:hypothetical protein n=1 Tax=Paenibacillus sp. L3-i20 TaxID=2905833 RepID=UPI00208D019D|nr:hypothetical protein [Paenibacillus sp. L3-i20]GKU77770.1 hypothetical protein L3i20_v221670 [Paenibacillus sp. L3-i20]